MKLLEGKNAVVFGVANNRSIAWGIAQAFHEHGANVGISYAGEMMEKRARPLGESLGLAFIEPCDVARDEDIAAVAEKAKAHFGQVDILVHAIAYAPREALSGEFHQTSREDFRVALDISAYSFIGLARAFLPILRPGASLMSMTYYAAEKVVPNYNVMAIAKAALENITRYLAGDLGKHGIRVNAISAGPIRTLAAAGVSGFRGLYKRFAEVSPLHQEITPEDVGGAAVFLASDLSKKISGEVLFVDGGFNIVAIPDDMVESSEADGE